MNITIKLGKRTIKLTGKEAKDLHKQLDEMFEGEKQRAAARSLEEAYRKLTERMKEREHPPIFTAPWRDQPRERRPSPQWPREAPDLYRVTC